MKFIFLFAAVIFPFSSAHASGFGLEGIGPDHFMAEPAAVPVPGAPKALTPLPAAEPLPPQPERAWTVMVYMNGKNDLTFSVRGDLNEMEEAGSTPEMNVVAQMGHIGTSERDWPVSRVFVKKDEYPNYISSPALETRDGADMGDWKELAGFINWAKKNFPARKYLLIVSGHGTGWDSVWKPSSTGKGIAFDDQSGRHIDTQGLRLALEAGGGVDVYASDSCLMQMAEVAYEIRGSAGLIAGSEEAEPGGGFNYGTFLNKAAALGDPSPRDLARALTEAFAETYPDRDATYSFVDASKLGGLVPLLDDWVAAGRTSKENRAIGRAAREATRFHFSDYVDLADFLRLAGIYAKTPQLRAASEKAAGYIRRELVGHSAATGRFAGKATGLSVVIPYRFDKAYLRLAFARDSQWDEFAARMAIYKD
ncbi:MAG: clostripain-related cysteine peptidase [Elusimicrobiales bacterium]